MHRAACTRQQSCLPVALHGMFVGTWTVMHSLCYSSQDVHRSVVKKGLVTGFCGASSNAEGKKKRCRIMKNWYEICSYVSFSSGDTVVHALPSTVPHHVNVPSCVSTPSNNAFSDYHFLTH